MTGTVRMELWMSADLHDRLDTVAKVKGVSLQSLVSEVLENFVTMVENPIQIGQRQSPAEVRAALRRKGLANHLHTLETFQQGSLGSYPQEGDEQA